MADISVLEQWLVELINRVRLDPLGTLGARLNQGLAPGTLTGEARQALAHSDILQATSSFHNNWMLENDVFNTRGQSGSRPGDRIEYAGYPTGGEWTWGETINWRGYPPGSSLNYETVTSWLWDALIADPQLRQLMLRPTFAEIGVSEIFGDYTLNGAAWYAGLLTIDYASTEGGRYITGMAFHETLPDWTYSPKQGYAGIAVAGTDESGVTRAAGGYDILATSDDQVVTLGGITVSLVMPDGNVKIDLISQNTIASSHTMTVISGATSARLLGSANEGLFAADTAGAVALHGNTGANRLVGNVLGNRIDGGAGADTMEGRQGDDVYFVDNAKDRIVELGGHGQDTVRTAVSYVLTAGAEVEVLETQQGIFTDPINLTGNEFRQSIYGNHGHNRLDGGKGADKMYGSLGDDQYVVDNVGDRVYEWAGEGVDHVFASVNFSLFGKHVENLTLTGTNGLNGTGNALANTITGNHSNNVLDGGKGADHLYGNRGDDTYIVDDSRDRVYENNREGNDTVLSAVSYSLAGVFVENLTLTGAAHHRATGNGYANILTGNSGSNAISGGGGKDTLFGGGGSDRFIFDTAPHVSSVDTILDFATGKDKIYLDRDVFKAFAADGAMSASAFKNLGDGPVDGNDRVLFNGTTGDLFYDADGSGGGAAIRFAILANGATIASSDFLLI